MKKKNLKVLCLLSLFICFLASCGGFNYSNNTDTMYFDSIYCKEKVVLNIKDVYWNQGLSGVGGTEYVTKKSINDALEELKYNGVSLIGKKYGKKELIQINNKGMYSFYAYDDPNYDNKTHVLIEEMHIYDNNGIYPFPIYAIYKDPTNQVGDVSIYETYQNVDKEYTINSIKEFNEIVNAYYNIEERDDSINLFYNNMVISLKFDGTDLLINTKSKSDV